MEVNNDRPSHCKGTVPMSQPNSNPHWLPARKQHEVATLQGPWLVIKIIYHLIGILYLNFVDTPSTSAMATYFPNDIVTQDFQLQVSKYLNVAAVAAFLFDYCLTFSSEVHHVWGKKWEITRIVFTISRYLPFVASAMTCVLYGNNCGAYNYVLHVIYNFCVVSAEVILILRTYALWGRKRWVLAILIPLAVTCIIAATLVGAMAGPRLREVVVSNSFS
ncbi:hypothetical protein BDN67DRAFT_378275 [Paxillus ammoniavirescens]|nr:hypothetical protein BDN67DRAFT_378275 [Paxillus ammoniavirescens]